MGTTTPLLFGVDPDETWDYIPEAAREAKLSLPSFTLRAPSLSLATKRASLLSKKRAAIRTEVPGVAEELSELFGDKWTKPADDAAADLKAKFLELVGVWGKAWGKVTKDLEPEQTAIDAEYLSTCVAGWNGLQSRTEKDLDFGRLKDRIPEVLRGSLREEIIGAIDRGATLTLEENEGLPSTPAS
jgi:hypothetical protein